MGTTRFGAPWAEIDFLRATMGIHRFFEGGTYRGGTAREAAKRFAHVVTVENSLVMQEVAAANLATLSNVCLLKGDSRQHLPDFVAQHEPALYWLDAHWSGGATYGEGDECPLLEELAVVFSGPATAAILIDDARLFLAPPPLPHERAAWPTLTQVMGATPAGWDLLVHDDVMYLLPNSAAEPFRDFLQKRITNGNAINSPRGFLASLFSRKGHAGA